MFVVVSCLSVPLARLACVAAVVAPSVSHLFLRLFVGLADVRERIPESGNTVGLFSVLSFSFFPFIFLFFSQNPENCDYLKYNECSDGIEAAITNCDSCIGLECDGCLFREMNPHWDPESTTNTW